MCFHDIACVTLYEVKQQSRRWEFQLFVVVSLVGITLCHVYWQNYNTSWEASALPCSVPLMNAYLFSVVQSLFVILMMTDFPRREQVRGEMECIFVRPLGNMIYTWSKILGNLVLFVSVNIVVILSCLLFVHMGCVAPYRFGFYLFYVLTLSIPSFLFMTGLSLCLARLIRCRFFVLIFLLGLWVLSIVWLPYKWHGTFDFLGGGLPNLFSDITGHVGLSNYLLHRSCYFLLGFGCLLLSVWGMRRIPNSSSRVKVYSLVGFLLILSAFVSMYAIEKSYLSVREIRSVYRDSFRHYWSETCSRVSRHEIVLQQTGDILSSCSDLTLYNPNCKVLDKLILFLNPGLHIETLLVAGKEIPFHRAGQVVEIDYALGEKDSVRLQVRYRGRIDERFSDLHLSDSIYEDSFQGNYFFPTGRRSAFVGDDYILLTPACAWYPVAIPPVNPEIPAYTGRDFTRFQLTVLHAGQKVLCSQGKAERRKDSCFFKPSNPLSGISLCGGNYELHEQRIPDLNMRFYTFKTRGNPLREVGGVRGNGIHAYLSRWIYPNKPYGWTDRDWYEKDTRTLFFMEVPLSFTTDAWQGKILTGMVEPGMVFLQEKGFGLVANGFKDETRKMAKSEYIFDCLMGCFNSPYKISFNLHPLLGMGRSVTSPYASRRLNPFRVFGLLEESGVWIQSEEYPFVGYLFDRVALNRGQYIESVSYFPPMEQHRRDSRLPYECLSGKSLYALFRDNRMRQDILYNSYLLKELELVDRISERIPLDTFFVALTDVLHPLQGLVSMDVFEQEMSSYLGKELCLKEILDDWLYTEHRQFFKVKDLCENHYPAGIVEIHKMEDFFNPTEWIELKGKVMNKGKTGGVVSVNFRGVLGEEEVLKHYSCYLEPGEAKSFYLVVEVIKNFASSAFYTGLSANEPRLFNFDVIRHEEEIKGMEAVDCIWRDIDPSEFDLADGEIIVDDKDEGFSIKDANRTWFQKWFEKPLKPRAIMGSTPSRWTPSVDIFYYGDSVRSGYFKGFGKGDYTATWRTELKMGGKYRVLARVSRYNIDGLRQLGVQNGVIYHYTVESVNGKEQISVDLDRFFQPRQWVGWVSLGEFDLPEGEVSVTLSDYDELGRDFIAVVADAVKWEKLED